MPISGVAEREKSLIHQVNASQATSPHTLLLDEPRFLLASLSAPAEPLSEKANLMSRHVPLLRWTQFAILMPPKLPQESVDMSGKDRGLPFN